MAGRRRVRAGPAIAVLVCAAAAACSGGKDDETSAEKPAFCYRTLGDVDCYAHPQPQDRPQLIDPQELPPPQSSSSAPATPATKKP